MINGTIFQWIATKKGPRMVETNPEGRHLKGWEKDPANPETQRRTYQELIFKKWADLTFDQQRGIYNHEILYTFDIVGGGPKAHYIFFEQRGTFEISASEQPGKMALSFILCSGLRFHLLTSPAGLTKAAAARWLKHFAQYLTDEPGELNVMICQQIPIAPYVNIPAAAYGVVA